MADSVAWNGLQHAERIIQHLLNKLIMVGSLCLRYVYFHSENNKGGPHLKPTKLEHIFVTCHNFFSLSSVQIIIIPACCLLCVL